MSLYNGNGMKTTGRSSSQRSVYDYPEHLNPFYEDENHKRLRFWKINTEKGGRSNSFSLDGLKGLWSFKSFKLKKRSSTLGINKTSESPPTLRREEDPYGSRSTVNIGLGNNFQRGAGYRCSLQDINRNPPENLFIRNNRYRSTMQPGSLASSSGRYQSNVTIGAVTPTLRSRFNQPTLSRGSSQTSVNSTNPFEDDYLDTVSQIDSPGQTPIRRSGRKKRRAPPPPTSPSNASNKAITIVEESSAEGEQRSETVNITNLTAEIESFVRTADTDKEIIVEKREENTEKKINEIDSNVRKGSVDRSKNTRQSPESNDYYPQDEQTEQITLEKIENLGAVDNNLSSNGERSKKSPVKILIRAPTDEEQTTVEISEVDDVPIKTVVEPESDYEAKDTERETIVVKSEQIEKRETDTENKATKVVVSERVEPKVEVSEKVEQVKSLDEEDEIRKMANTTPTSTEVEFILENDAEVHAQNSCEKIVATNLRITESTDDLTEIKEEKPTTFEVANEPMESSPIVARKESLTKETAPEQSDANATVAERCIVVEKNLGTPFRVSTVPLKIESPVALRKNISSTTSENKREPPTPPQRRRSVKEIIESINKCQRLLKVNQDANTNKTDVEKANANFLQSSSSTSNARTSTKNTLVDRNMNDLSVKQYNDKKMFSEINNNGKCDDEINNIPLFVEKFNEFNSNNPNLFEKCVIRRDSKSHDVDQKGKISNMVYNPVPKPRRHRNSAQGSIN